jgi:hypothetical protein
MNEAQMIYARLGVSASQLIAHHKGKLPSFRKKGPGRKHKQGRARK